MQKQVASDEKDQFAVTGLTTDEHGRQFAAAILTRLGEQKACRDELQEWLIANAATTQEELVSNWWRHSQKIRLASFEFLEDRDVSILRIQNPRPGDRPVEQVQTMRVMAAFKKLGKSLPAADAAILDNEYS
ncbi:hypothetical protein [Massilia scottii]|uniref:hypothetical protein n=1 Tax=Massilia scottii TaxID=3057166 RepID=UPI002796BB2C|nr:hypothetical protein [Massilia sp. CCM 9029]MDQ1829395.1 hypothetical protein [Massilia sp. CCM 9029]